MFPFFSHIHVFSRGISFVCRLNYPYSCFSLSFCFLVVVLLIIVLFVLFLDAVISLSLLFFMQSSRPCIDSSWRCLECCWVHFLVFLTHIVCLCHLSDVRPYASTLVSSGPFVIIIIIILIGNYVCVTQKLFSHLIWDIFVFVYMFSLVGWLVGWVGRWFYRMSTLARPYSPEVIESNYTISRC